MCWWRCHQGELLHAHCKAVPGIRCLLTAAIEPTKELINDFVEVGVQPGTVSEDSVGIVVPTELGVRSFPEFGRGHLVAVCFQPLRVFHDLLFQPLLLSFNFEPASDKGSAISTPIKREPQKAKSLTLSLVKAQLSAFLLVERKPVFIRAFMKHTIKFFGVTFKLKSEDRVSGPLPSMRITAFPRCRVGGGAPCGAGLRPLPKLYVQFSRIQLS